MASPCCPSQSAVSVSDRIQISCFQSNWSVSKKKAPGVGRGEGSSYAVRSVAGHYQALQTRGGVRFSPAACQDTDKEKGTAGGFLLLSPNHDSQHGELSS